MNKLTIFQQIKNKTFAFQKCQNWNYFFLMKQNISYTKICLIVKKNDKNFIHKFARFVKNDSK